MKGLRFVNMWIDSHAHLNDTAFEPDYREVLQQAIAGGVDAVIVPGFDLESSRKAVAMAQVEPRIWAAVGFQPEELESWTPGALEEMADLLNHPKVVAVGEIGLDYHYGSSNREEQLAVFRAQLDLARRFRKPVIIHSREAAQDTLTLLQEARAAIPETDGFTGVMHCFSGSWETAQQYLQLGLEISFAGPVTFPKALNLQRVAQLIPPEHLLIETDSPYLSPTPFRGQRNEPLRVELVGAKIAEIKGMQPEKLARITRDNCSRLFGITL